MSNSQELVVKITARTDGVTLAFQRTTREAERFSDRLRRFGRNSYFGRLIADLKKLRQESRDAWRQMSTLERTTQRLRQIGGLASGGMAAAWVLREPVKQTMDFDLRMRHMANTAFAGESLDRRREGAKQIETAVHNAVRRYGGDRDSAAAGLDRLIASGILQPDQAMAALPEIQKYASGFGAQSDELAAIALAGVQNMGVQADRIGRLFEMAGKGGQLGGFELREMARWLPEQSSAAQAAGLSGEQGFARLVAMNQAARTTARSPDEAGNNMANLLTKMRSQDTIGALRSKFGVDLTRRYEEGLLQGKDTAQVFMETISGLVAKDAQFQKAMQMAERARAAGDKSAATWGNIANVVEGSVIGKIINDRQANAALAGIMGNQGYLNDVYSKVLAAQGVGDDNFALISESNSFKAQQFWNEKDIKTQEAFEPFNNGLGMASEKLVQFSNAFPSFSTAATGAGYTGAALAAGGLGNGLFMKLSGGLSAGGSGAGAGVGAGASGGPAASAGLGTKASLALAAAPLALMYGATELAGRRDKYGEWAEFLRGITSSIDDGFRQVFGWAGYETTQEKDLRQSAERLQEASPKNAQQYQQQYERLKSILDGNEQGAKQAIEEAGKSAANLILSTGNQRQYQYPHFFRHSLAMNLLRNSSAKEPLRIVKSALGHRNINTTAIYTEASREEVAAAMDEADKQPRQRINLAKLRRDYEKRMTA